MNLIQNNLKTRRMKIIAAVCAVTVLAGSTAGIYAFSSNSEPKVEEAEEVKKENPSEKDSGIISGGGTVTSSQLSDQLGMKNTSVRLTVDEVLAESGDSVTTGTELYKLTEDSVEKAKKTLESELKSAENALTEQKTSAQADKIKAKTLYESQLLLGDTAEEEYESSLTALDSSLQKALEDYQEAQNTVNNTPLQISQKQAEVNSVQSLADGIQQQTDSVSQELDEVKKAYTSAAANYNALLTEYNSAASVVRYLGDALGSDMSYISIAEEAPEEIEEQNTAPADSGSDSDRGETPSFDGGDPGSADFGSFDSSQFDMSSMLSGGDTQFDMSSMPSGGDAQFDMSSMPSGGDAQFDKSSMPSGGDTQFKPQTSDSDTKTAPAQTERNTEASQQPAVSEDASKTRQTDSAPAEGQQQAAVTVSAVIQELYDKAYDEYTAQKDKLDEAQQALNSAEQEYRNVSASLSELNSELKEAQNNITSLNKEISSLESALSKANSDLSKLRSEYNSLNTSYETDKLELKNKLDTDLAAYENAEFHYELTCSTIEKELQEKQDAYDTAKENLSIFEEQLSDGYIRAMQDGTVYSLSGQAGRSLDVGSPFVYYVDRSDLTVTVELDQYDVTEIGIGDKVIIYSSETGMTNGKITAIAAGESTSLADVRFNVTVTADEGSSLYSGQSVNVYFNYTASLNGSLKDFNGGTDEGSDGSGSGRSRPDFGGGNMPEGFDPSNMPTDFDFSNMPGFGGRKGE